MKKCDTATMKKVHYLRVLGNEKILWRNECFGKFKRAYHPRLRDCTARKWRKTEP